MNCALVSISLKAVKISVYIRICDMMKEVVVAYSKVLSWLLSGRTEAKT
jgi:hypothetical protein